MEKPQERESLRKQAEKKLVHRPKAELRELTSEEAARLIHELEVHQVELEMQNEELRRAHVELEESRTKYSDLYDFAPVGYFTFDKDGLILEANLTGAGLLGVERRHLIKKPFSQYIVKDHQDLFFLHRRKVFDANERQTCEIRIQRKGSDKFYALMESIHVEDSKGNRVCRSSLIDISERKRIEEEALKLLKELESIFNYIPVGIVYLDNKFRILSANRFFSDFSGFREEELKGKLCYEIVGEYSHDPTRKGLDKICSFCKKEECFNNKRPTFMERPLEGKYIRVTTIPEINERGEIYRFMEFVEDITEQKLAMAHIESLSRFPSENPNPVLRISSEKKVLYKNRAFDLLLSDHGLSEKDIFNILPENLDILIDEALKKNQPYYLLDVHVGNKVFSYNLIPVTENKYVNLYGRDITERKKAEEALKAAKDELEIKVTERTAELRATIEILNREIKERKEAEDAMRETKNELRSMYDAITDMMTVISPDYRIISANRVVQKQFGENLVGKVCYEAYQGRNEICPDCPTRKAIETKQPAVSFQPGTEISPPVEIYAFPILNSEGDIISVVEHGKDITERKEAEEKIKAALREKEVLLKEIHHRVKNNMTVVSSLLQLQADKVKDKQYRDMFSDSMQRIKTMARIHEKLYQSGDLAKINFSDYIRDMADSMYTSYGLNPSKVQLIKEIETITLGVDSANPCGLIINELLSNSLKYAFPEGRKGEIRVVLRKNDNDEIELMIADNGVGIPDGLDFKKTDSLGLNLVTALVRQLQGKIELNREKGTEFKITFGGCT